MVDLNTIKELLGKDLGAQKYLKEGEVGDNDKDTFILRDVSVALRFVELINLMKDLTVSDVFIAVRVEETKGEAKDGDDSKDEKKERSGHEHSDQDDHV